MVINNIKINKMKYPVIYYNGFAIERKKFIDGSITKYFFVVDLIEQKFNTITNAKNYIDYLAK
jgi:hypothetical protein